MSRIYWIILAYTWRPKRISNPDVIFYGWIECPKDDCELLRKIGVVGDIKYRNRFRTGAYEMCEFRSWRSMLLAYAQYKFTIRAFTAVSGGLQVDSKYQVQWGIK